MISNWISKSTLPYEVDDSSSVVVYNGKIHILGGRSGKSKHYSWDGEQWIEESTLPYNFWYGSAVIYNNEIHILGGVLSQYSDAHYSWNGKRWVQYSVMPEKAFSFASIVYDGKIHIMGNANPGSGMGHYSWDGSQWSDEPDLIYETRAEYLVIYNNKIHVIDSINDTFYSWEGGTSYSEYGPLPENKIMPAVIHNNKLYVLGSDMTYYFNNEEWPYGEIWIEDFELPIDFQSGLAVEYDGTIHILGGNNSEATSHYSYETLYPNKVIYGEDTVLDLSNDTATADKVLLGETFHDRKGILRTGTMVPKAGNKVVLIEGTAQDSPIGVTGIGTWQDVLNNPTKADEQSWGWVEIPELNGIGDSDNIRVVLSYDPAKSDVISLGGYIIDDETNMMCIKFGNTISVSDTHTAVIGVEIIENEVST